MSEKTGYGACGEWVCLRTVPRQKSSNIKLPESSRFEPHTFTVLAMGDRAMEELGAALNIGDTCLALIDDGVNHITLELDGLRAYWVNWRKVVGPIFTYQG